MKLFFSARQKDIKMAVANDHPVGTKGGVNVYYVHVTVCKLYVTYLRGVTGPGPGHPQRPKRLEKRNIG